MFQCILLLIPHGNNALPMNEPRQDRILCAGGIAEFCKEIINAEFCKETREERFFILNEQRSIWQELQLQGRRFTLKVALGASIAVLAMMVLVGTTSGLAHAVTTSQRTYTIVSGDTLSGLSSEFGVSIATLAAANNIADPNLIHVGQTLVIPNGNTASTTSSGSLSGSYQDMIYQVFGQYGAGAVNVAMCESSMNPNAYNGILGAAGLFQIIPGTFASTSYAGQSVYNPEVNIRAAYEIFARDGYTWSEWACKP
jgi:LysM repeat protein